MNKNREINLKNNPTRTPRHLLEITLSLQLLQLLQLPLLLQLPQLPLLPPLPPLPPLPLLPPLLHPKKLLTKRNPPKNCQITMSPINAGFCTAY
jgi:hypothetical protein